LVIGLHWFGTSDRIEWSEPVFMRLLCHALVQRLRDEVLSDAAVCLSGIYDFQSVGVPELGLTLQGRWLASGINSLIRKRIDALTQEADTGQVASSLKMIRDQLASSLEYADQGMGLVAERLELGDLTLGDQDSVPRITGAVARHVPDDAALACDPDEHAE
jgi:hypothetical protein